MNDPTTALSCVDQLSCILIRWLSRGAPQGLYSDPPHVVRVVIPWIKFEACWTWRSIRHYAAGDAAVSLRLMRALGDIASTVGDPAIRLLLLERGKRLLAGCEVRLQKDDLAGFPRLRPKHLFGL